MNAFVYGTLRAPDRAREVVGHADFGPAVRLRGLHPVDGRYPTLAPGGETKGRVLRLQEGDLEALDAHEGVDRELYVRVRVPSDRGGLWTYVGDPDRLNADATWPGEGSLRGRIERYIETNDVRIEP